jgi:hypothetical protein
MYKELLDKGFKRTIYKEQEGVPAFYRIDIKEPETIKNLLEVIGEYMDQEDDISDVSAVIEVTEDFKHAQYSFGGSEGDWAFDRLTIDDFKKVLEVIPESVVIR